MFYWLKNFLITANDIKSGITNSKRYPNRSQNSSITNNRFYPNLLNRYNWSPLFNQKQTLTRCLVQSRDKANYLFSKKRHQNNKSNVTIETLLLFNLGAFLVTIALGGIIFLSSCIFNRSRRAMALGGGFAVLTMVFTILGMFASDSTPSMMRMDALSPFNYVSLVTLYDISSILDGTLAYIWKFAILGGIAVVCFIVGISVFKKKDLPL